MGIDKKILYPTLFLFIFLVIIWSDSISGENIQINSRTILSYLSLISILLFSLNMNDKKKAIIFLILSYIFSYKLGFSNVFLVIILTFFIFLRFFFRFTEILVIPLSIPLIFFFGYMTSRKDFYMSSDILYISSITGVSFFFLFSSYYMQKILRFIFLITAFLLLSVIFRQMHDVFVSLALGITSCFLSERKELPFALYTVEIIYFLARYFSTKTHYFS